MNVSAVAPIDAGLPNRDAIRWLIDRYYREGFQAGDMSSHWRVHSEQLLLSYDSTNGLQTLEGFGFGNARWGSAGHQMLDRACEAAHLARLPQRRALVRLRPRLVRVCRRAGLDPTLDAFRQLCTLELLMRHESRLAAGAHPRFLVIGDGFGVLGSLVKEVWPDASIVLVDLGQTLLFQVVHCQKAHPTSIHALIDQAAGLDRVDFLYCPSDRLEAIESLDFDVAVNVASMQEMAPDTVAAYFAFLRRRLKPANLFYCCNRERKRLPGGEESAFMTYPWLPADRLLVDGPCPWHQYYFTTGWARQGPRVAGVPVPLVGYYEGRHLHRLAVLATERH
jgi:hypothetical protein